MILNEHPVSYLDEMQAQLTALLDDGPWSTWQHRPGGAYLLRARPHGPRRARARSRPSRARSCTATAATCARSSNGPTPCRPPAPLFVRDCAAEPARDGWSSCGDAVDDPRRTGRRLHRRRTEPTRSSLERRGGNAAALGERHREPGTSAPSSRPPGPAHTWSGNSRENRLTPFANDPVADPTAEALFIRDDDSGEAWSPTPGPVVRSGPTGVSFSTPPACRTSPGRPTASITSSTCSSTWTIRSSSRC